MSNDMPADGKQIVNAVYHGAMVSGLAMGYAHLTQMVLKGSIPKLDLTPRDIGIVVLDVTLAMAIKDTLVKQGILLPDIMK